jgi:DNA-binding transcriptional ArsR family regulator
MTAESLNSTFLALADPTRRAILERLTAGETSETGLAGPFRISLPTITKHLKVLERAGLITRTREAQWRPCHLPAGPLAEALGWLEPYRQHWKARLDRLEELLAAMNEREELTRPPE